MWTANLRSKELRNGVLFVVVDFFDGQQLVNKEFALHVPQVLEELVNDEIKRLSDLSDFAAKLEVGPVNAPAPPDPPTKDDIDRANYLALRRKLSNALADVNAGILKADDPIVAQLYSDIKVAYKPEYSGL